MRALVIHKYGSPDVLSYEETKVPQPGKDEVLVKVYAAAINPVDYKIRNGSIKFLSGFRFPKVLGGDLAGIVEQSFDGSAFKPGDKVFAMLSLKGGAYAEYATVPEKSLCLIPREASFTEAAAIPLAGLTAYQALVKKGKIKPDMRVFINGASGGVGHFGVQIAKSYGALVVASCSAKNSEFVKSLGADEIIDYQKTNITRLREKFNIFFDAVASGSYASFSRLLNPEGVYVATIPSPLSLMRQGLNFMFSRKCYAIMAKPLGSDLKVLASLFEDHKLKPYVSLIIDLKEGNKAHTLIETHRVTGKIVLRIRG
jgi:NADPH:quinone reductase-like Zn-dependent oxidoreductase